jgi:hypothetical protein
VSELDTARLLSGQSGIVTGRRARLRARAGDIADEAALWSRLVPPRLDRAARTAANGSVLVLGIYAPDCAALAARAVEELRASRRDVTFALGALDDTDPALAAETVASGLRGAGKFENLNALFDRARNRAADWIVVADDDVELPGGFLDRMLFCAERFTFGLAQPALTHSSHAAWPVCRRERGLVARRTRLVEIGPLTAFHRSLSAELLPFPPLRMGWGLDLHWGGLARARDWRLGIVDAAAIKHQARVTATTYDREQPVAELRDFLSGRPHIDRQQALEVLERHRRWK